MTGALLSFSTMAVSIRALYGTLDIIEILAIRNASGLAILLALGLAQPHLLRSLTLRRAGLQLTRNTIHFGAQYMWAVSLTLLPLATVFALEFTMPAYAAILAVIFFCERLTPGRIGVGGFGLLRVAVVLPAGLERVQPAVPLVVAAPLRLAA